MSDTDDLHDRARRGDRDAFDELFRRCGPDLRQAIQLRLDRRVRARVDVSDVLQETYLEALRRLPEYVRRPPAPFALWLRWLARDRLLVLHRRHLGTDMRSVRRELPPLPADSSARLLGGLEGTSPSQALAAGEQSERLRLALQRLDDDEREVVLMRHFDQLGNGDIAWMLGLSESAAHKRYIRALQRLRGLLLELGITGT